MGVELFVNQAGMLLLIVAVVETRICLGGIADSDTNHGAVLLLFLLRKH
ncbi:hypothetical protein ULG90_18230 [Halopseudomonas pachastrellae]|nr:hypothetical protein ULG90_18230 [Halopseudomonas pachastrellae]